MPKDLFYRSVRAFGRFGFFCTSRATILHAERSKLEGPWLLAANHASVYDVGPILRSCERVIDWVSITEVFQYRVLRWLYGNMGAFPVDRTILDTAGLQTIYDRLAAGRVVGIFPEGAVATGEVKTILEGGEFRSAIGKIAHSTGVPVVPCVHVDTKNMAVRYRWLPLRLIRYGIIFGKPIFADPSLNRREAARKLEQDLGASMRKLHVELLAAYDH